MRRYLAYLAGSLGGCALLGSLLTSAFASPPPPAFQPALHSDRATTVGSLRVNGILRVNRNASTYGRLYAHGGIQVWKGLTVRTGTLAANSLDVSGAITAQSATVAGTVQAGPVSAASLTLSGALTSSGRIAGNGVDAGTAGLTTSGPINGGALTAGSVSDSGALSAGAATLSSLTVSGAVTLPSATINNLTAPNGLTIGGSSGKTAQLGVNSSGALTVSDLVTSGNVVVGGNLSVAGTATLNVSSLAVSTVTAPNASGTTTPGPLTIQGSVISLVGNAVSLNTNTTLAGGADLSGTVSGSNATHLVANGDRDLAGTVTVPVTSNVQPGGVATYTISFVQPFASAPTVTVTPVTDPQPGSSYQPKIWLNVTKDQFTIYLAPTQTHNQDYTVVFDYHVTGA
jgi:hypothetical protein